MSRWKKLWQYARTARQQTGKSVPSQWMEMLRLARGEHRLGIQEYYELEVFDDKIYPGTRKAECIGWRTSARIDQKLNRHYWRAAANDKVLNYALLQQYGLPAPETLATFSPAGRRIGKERALASEAELRAYVTTEMRFPVFVKPISGTYGRGTFLFTGYDAATRTFTDSQGQRVGLDDFVQVCLNRPFSGMLFQTPLQPHPQVRALTGPATSCVRVIVALLPSGPQVHLAFWKIARAHNITDNFHMGATGNLLAALDKTTGRIERVITGLWPDGKEITHHPDTQQPLLGQVLPDWPRAMALCLAAAPQFPGLRLQHWDVAFCDTGPVLMELNTEADLSVPQTLVRRPFIDESLRALLQS